VATETVAECDDDDDDDDDDEVEDENEDETERSCQDVSAAVNGDSVSASASPPHDSMSASSPPPHDVSASPPHDAADQSDEEPELDTSKSKLPKSGLRIKLSLKPVRKSTREHKAPVSIHG